MSAPPCLALYRFLLLLLAVNGMTPMVSGQHFSVQKYTVNDGLPDSYIFQVYQDRQGFIWIGTVNGLSRFDGREFLNFGHETGMPDLRVDAIYEDHHQRLWVGTRKGIGEIRGHQCITYPMDDGLPVSFVFRFREAEDGGTLAFTNKGCYRFEGSHWKKVHLLPGLEDHHCRDLVTTPHGTYINYGDYFVLHKPSGDYKVLGHYPRDIPYYNSMQRSGQDVYLSLPGSLLSVQATGNVPLFTSALQGKTLGAYFRDSRGRFWLSTEEQGLLISKKGNFREISDTMAIPYHLVSQIYEDREGNIWIACYDGLLKVKDVDYSVFSDPCLRDLRNMIRTPDNRLLAATTHGLLQYREGAFIPLPLSYLPAPAAKDMDGLVDDWCNDDKGRTWLMMRLKNLFVADFDLLREASIYGMADPLNRAIGFNRHNHKLYVCADSLLMYGDEHGFGVFREAGSGKYITNPHSVQCLVNGNVLVWTSGNEFLLIDTTGKIRSLTGAFGIPRINQHVGFYEEPSGKCWVTFTGGLARYHWDAQQQPVKEVMFTSREGLPSDIIHAVTMDGDHRLWVVTGAGIVVIETGPTPGDRPVVNNFSEEEGVMDDLWSRVGLLTDSSGAVWIHFSDRILRLQPGRVQFDHRPPPVAIEDVHLTQKTVSWTSWSDSLYGYRQLPRHIRLPYDLNSLSIAYRAPCFNGSSGVEYSYQLEGSDDQWSLPTRNNSVEFVRLPPGNYHFRVRARKSNTIWSEPVDLSFFIGRPYWDTWLFRGCVALLLLTLTGSLVWYRIRQFQRKAQLREQVRELELKALRAQMNPHFIYNALNSIQALVLDDRPEEATLYISKFSRVLRQVLNHSEKSLIPLAEELEALKLYLQLEQLRLHVDLHYDIRVDPSLRPEEERVPPLILQPFAENSLWHGLSRKKGDKLLKVLVHAEGEWLVVEITDNGIGRQQAERIAGSRPGKISRGMEITGRRIREHNGGQASVEVTDLYDAEERPAGTRVMIRMKRKKDA